MENLVTLIEKKAKAKLTEDIRNFLKEIHDNPLFLYIKDEIVVLPEDKRMNFWSFLFPGESKTNAYGIIMKKALPNYIIKESEEFMSKVEILAKDVAQLLTYPQNNQ